MITQNASHSKGSALRDLYYPITHYLRRAMSHLRSSPPAPSFHLEVEVTEAKPVFDPPYREDEFERSVSPAPSSTRAPVTTELFTEPDFEGHLAEWSDTESYDEPIPIPSPQLPASSPYASYHRPSDIRTHCRCNAEHGEITHSGSDLPYVYFSVLVCIQTGRRVIGITCSEPQYFDVKVRVQHDWLGVGQVEIQGSIDQVTSAVRIDFFPNSTDTVTIIGTHSKLDLPSNHVHADSLITDTPDTHARLMIRALNPHFERAYDIESLSQLLLIENELRKAEGDSRLGMLRIYAADMGSLV